MLLRQKPLTTKITRPQSGSELIDVLCMDATALQKRSEGPTPFGAGVTLDQEEREQEQQRAQLLVAQLDFKRQLKHGGISVSAGSAANWLKVGFGDNDDPGVSVGSLNHLTACMPTRRGLGCVAQNIGRRTLPNSLMHNVRVQRRADVGASSGTKS